MCVINMHLHVRQGPIKNDITRELARAVESNGNVNASRFVTTFLAHLQCVLTLDYIQQHNFSGGTVRNVPVSHSQQQQQQQLMLGYINIEILRINGAELLEAEQIQKRFARNLFQYDTFIGVKGGNLTIVIWMDFRQHFLSQYHTIYAIVI